MSLLAFLGLPTLAPSNEPSRASAAKPAPAPTKAVAKGGKKSGGKPKTINFDDGEGSSIVAGEPTVNKIALGQVVWANGQGKRQVWGLINTAGELAQSGANWHEKALVEMNTVAARGVELVVGLQEREEKFRLDLFRVKNAVKEGAKGLAEVKKLGKAIGQRMKTDDDFYEDVKGFTTALAEAKKSAKGVSEAAHDFQAAKSALQAAILDEKSYTAKKDVADAEDAVKAKQEQIDEAKAIFKTVLDIAEKVVKQEWGAIATKALAYAQEKATDAAADALVAGRLNEQLAQLKENLRQARTRVTELDKAALYARIQEKQFKLESAMDALEKAHFSLTEAVKDLPGAQRNAINELEEKKDTKPAARMIEARITQIGAIDTALSSCGEYARVADKVHARMQKFINLFQQVSTFLQKAAKEKPYYADDKPYGRELNRASLANAIAFGDWAMSIAGVKREAEEALKWLAKTDADGPLGKFDEAIEFTRTSMGAKV